MAVASLFTLLDDITALLDDVASMSKVAAGKTAGVVGDDLALNANQVMGTPADRELPVVWSVAKGSLINKAILVPAAILLSAFLPFMVTPLLMLGGLYLCFEGAEKLLPHHSHEAEPKEMTEAQKIKGAIRTDFILSAEIIIIALGIVADQVLATRILTLSVIAIGMTVVVYGLVGAIVKLDDLGFYLVKKTGPLRLLGHGILKTAPWLMRALGILGTAAMFMVGGQILLHGIPPLHHALEAWSTGLIGMVVSGVFGLACGMVAAGAMKIVTALRYRLSAKK